MNPRTGEIITGISESLARDLGLVPMNEPPTDIQMLRKPPSVAKYESCPCGRGKKFKFCCFKKS